MLLYERELDGYRYPFPVVKRPGREAGYFHLVPRSRMIESVHRCLCGVFRDVAVPFISLVPQLHCTKLKAKMVSAVPSVNHTHTQIVQTYNYKVFTYDRCLTK